MSGSISTVESQYFQREFEICYQPILCLDEHRIGRFEVLLNWQRERQMIYPADCLGLLDQAGLTETLRNWVLQQIFQQLHTWHQSYSWIIDLGLNLHLSPKQFLAPGLIDQLQVLKHQYPLAIREIYLELDYHFIMANPHASTPLIRRLLALGCQIQINNFYPSNTALAVMKYLALDKIKLSTQFIQALSIDPQTIDVFQPVLNKINQQKFQVLIGEFKDAEQLAAIKTISAPSWSLLCGLPASSQDIRHLIDADSRVVPIKLVAYLLAMNKLSQCIQPFLGKTIVSKYWAAVRPDLQWLPLDTPTKIEDIHRLSNQVLDVNKVMMLQLWVERFIQKCSHILPNLAHIIREVNVTPTEFRLMKLAR